MCDNKHLLVLNTAELLPNISDNHHWILIKVIWIVITVPWIEFSELFGLASRFKLRQMV
jgi:hypothetical protein